MYFVRKSNLIYTLKYSGLGLLHPHCTTCNFHQARILYLAELSEISLVNKGVCMNLHEPQRVSSVDT